MKEKILKAIDKGLMNVLSTDIEDHDIDFDHDNINSEYIPYEYKTVDMGDAGIWCEYNLGAFPGNKASDWYGDYYAWGEVKIKDNYSWETYKHCKGMSSKITKYNKKDKLEQLKHEDDIIRQTLGNEFRMPTQYEYEKLIENTTNEWVKNYKGIQGLNGRLFIAENGNTLFFPTAGCHYYSDFHNNDYGYLWTASRYSDYHASAYIFYVEPDSANPNYIEFRFCGFSVRGIWNPL